MPYLSERFLLDKAYDSVLESRASVILQKTESLISSKRIFLSHSHQDKTLAKGMKNYLLSLGVDLYIDWLDTAMPTTTNIETANRIKSKIEISDHVLVLATNNAVKSRWVPWEIGVADVQKTPSGISIVPIADSAGRFEGNEYLQLYKRIIIAEGGQTAVFEPGATKGMLFENWAKSL